MTAGSCQEAGTSESCERHWLDALSDAAWILAPIERGPRRAVGFRVECANRAAAQVGVAYGADRIAAGTVVDQSFLGLEPKSAARLASLFRTVLKDGTAAELDGVTFEGVAGSHAVRHVRDIHVGRHGNNLLVILRDAAAPDSSRESEQDLRALVDGVEDEALMTIDPNGAVVSWNTGAHRMFGYSDKQIIGRHYSALYPADHEASGDGSDRTIETERSQSDTWQVRRDGSRFWADATIAASYGENGVVRGYSLVVRDLTDQAEQRRRDLQLSVMRALEAPLEINAAAVRIVELTTNVIGAKFGEVFGAPPPGSSARLLSRLGFPHSTLDLLDASAEVVPADPWAAVIAQVRATRASVVVADLGASGDPIQAAAASALGVRSVIASPILVEFGGVRRPCVFLRGTSAGGGESRRDDRGHLRRVRPLCDPPPR